MGIQSSNKIFGVVGFVFQLWFIILYAIDYQYFAIDTSDNTAQGSMNFQDIQGFQMVLILFLLFFLGFTLVNTYVAGSSYSSMLFSFMIIVFSIQYYFIVRSFWLGTGLANDDYTNTLGDGKFQLIRIISTDHRLSTSVNLNVGMTEAICSALSMLIAYMAVAGRVSGLQVMVLCFFGVFFYSFNETIIWRHAIADNGFTMRIFLFGSSLGLVSALILRIKDKIATTDTDGYFASRQTRTYGLLGACFVWIFLPIMSTLSQIYNPDNNDFSQITYLFPAILNTWFALSASTSISFCMSILLGYKIHPHDIVFSSFTGGIAYGATSNLNPDPFPALLIGLIVGVISTILNHKLKKPLNNPEVIDTQGTLYTFFVTSFIGGLYSACLTPVGPFGPDVTTSITSGGETSVTFSEDTSSLLVWLGTDRQRYQQGGFQVMGTFVSAAIGVFAGLAVGAIYALSAKMETAEVFHDPSFTENKDEQDQSVEQNRR